MDGHSHPGTLAPSSCPSVLSATVISRPDFFPIFFPFCEAAKEVNLRRSTVPEPWLGIRTSGTKTTALSHSCSSSPFWSSVSSRLIPDVNASSGVNTERLRTPLVCFTHVPSHGSCPDHTLPHDTELVLKLDNVLLIPPPAPSSTTLGIILFPCCAASSPRQSLFRPSPFSIRRRAYLPNSYRGDSRGYFATVAFHSRSTFQQVTHDPCLSCQDPQTLPSPQTIETCLGSGAGLATHSKGPNPSRYLLDSVQGLFPTD